MPARKKTKSAWFNEECENARKDFAKARNVFLKTKNDANRQEFVRTRTKYTRIKTKAKKLFKITEGQKLNDEAEKQPGKFWKKSLCEKLKRYAVKIWKLMIFFNILETFSNDDSQSENSENYEEENDTFDPDLDSDISLEELKNAVFHGQIHIIS